MGRKGQSSQPVTFRVAEGILEEIDEEIELFNRQSNRTEFITDSIKFYLDYLKNQRLEEARLKTVITRTAKIEDRADERPDP